jgi:hypothetical protein
LKRAAEDHNPKAAIALAVSLVSSEPKDFVTAQNWIARAKKIGVDPNDPGVACSLVFYYYEVGDITDQEYWKSWCPAGGPDLRDSDRAVVR